LPGVNYKVFPIRAGEPGYPEKPNGNVVLNASKLERFLRPLMIAASLPPLNIPLPPEWRDLPIDPLPEQYRNFLI
jgi:hypothetical protein